MSTERRLACVALAGLTLLAVGVAFHLSRPFVAPGLDFSNLALFRPWSGWTSTYMLVHPLGFGIVFALTYFMIWPGWGGWWGGLRYGLAVFLVGALPIWLVAFASFQVPIEVMTWFIVHSACQYLAAGAVVGAVAGQPSDAPESL